MSKLVWSVAFDENLTGKDLLRYIETGELSTTEKVEVMPYDPLVRELIAKNWEAAGGI